MARPPSRPTDEYGVDGTVQCGPAEQSLIRLARILFWLMCIVGMIGLAAMFVAVVVQILRKGVA
jgi:hypothetical protein